MVEYFMYTTFLCGLLTFSGLVSDSGIGQRRIAQTELSVSIQNSSVNTAPCRALSIVSNVRLSDHVYEIFNTAIHSLQYEMLVKIRFQNNLEYWISYKKPGKLLRTPYTTRSYTESDLSALRG